MPVKRVTATEAARSFAELLDAIDRDGEAFVIERRGRPVAAIGPPPSADGAALKRLIRANRPDSYWTADLMAVRSLLGDEAPNWDA